MDYAEADFVAEICSMALTGLGFYVIWAGGGFDWMRPELERTRWGTRKVRAVLLRAFRIRPRPHVPTGPTNEFTPTPEWMRRER